MPHARPAEVTQAGQQRACGGQGRPRCSRQPFPDPVGPLWGPTVSQALSKEAQTRRCPAARDHPTLAPPPTPVLEGNRLHVWPDNLLPRQSLEKPLPIRAQFLSPWTDRLLPP